MIKGYIAIFAFMVVIFLAMMKYNSAHGLKSLDLSFKKMKKKLKCLKLNNFSYYYYSLKYFMIKFCFFINPHIL